MILIQFSYYERIDVRAQNRVPRNLELQIKQWARFQFVQTKRDEKVVLFRRICIDAKLCTLDKFLHFTQRMVLLIATMRGIRVF